MLPRGRNKVGTTVGQADMSTRDKRVELGQGRAHQDMVETRLCGIACRCILTSAGAHGRSHRGLWLCQLHVVVTGGVEWGAGEELAEVPQLVCGDDPARRRLSANSVASGSAVPRRVRVYWSPVRASRDGSGKAKLRLPLCCACAMAHEGASSRLQAAMRVGRVRSGSRDGGLCSTQCCAVRCAPMCG